MRDRYLNGPIMGSAKIPSILYYDCNGNFRGVENGMDFQDDDKLLRMKWWENVMCSPLQGTDNTLGGG